ncbi:MAG: DNA polymerase delta catalytic subunit, partial [Trebouxia sp. A1-2]
MPVKRAAPATMLSGPETPQRVKRSHAAATSTATAQETALDNIADEAAGVFHIWGNASDGSSVLLRVHDFQPYFYIAGPLQAGPFVNGTNVEADLDEAACTGLMHALNRIMPPDGRIQKLVAMKRRPIMYYRPQAPQGSTFIKVLLAAGMNVKKAAGAVRQALQKDSLRPQGFTWLDLEQYEHEVNALQRFLVDTAVSGGSWIHVPTAAAQAPSAQTLAPTTPMKTGTSGHAGSSPALATGQVGGCQAVIAPWRSLQALTPDATQLADPTWRPTPFTQAGGRGGVAPMWQQAADWAKQGRINNLSLMALDVLMAPHDAKDRVAVPGQGDPIIAITCMSHASSQATSKAQPAAPAAELQLEGMTAEDEGLEGGLEGDLEPRTSAEGVSLETGGSEGAGGASTSESDESGRKLVFMWQARQAEAHFTEAVSGAQVYRYSSEERMLGAWLAHVDQMDPDAFYLYQVKDTLGAIAARFKALHIGGGGLFVGRLLAPHARPLTLKSVVRYSPNWVKNQNRMASTSNQETYRTDVDGRLVFDILRQVLNGVNLASFSLVDCAQTLLGQRLEVRLATVPETVELARATGLTLPQILYNAQMIRTWSLLLRNAQRQGYVVAGRQAGEPLQESPYLMHPVECNTVGLYKTPVAILDFASLYPSLYRAHNLCYSTLLHPDDVTGLPPEHTTEVLRPKANVKSHFVKPELRKGILPSILAALIEARAATRASLKEATDA